MAWKLFLDDERFPPKKTLIESIKSFFGIQPDWIVCRDYDAACHMVMEKGLPSYVSFDHDLGPGKNGYDFAKYLVNYCLDNNLRPTFGFYVHSQNPVGKANIEALIKSFKRTFE